MRLNRELLTTDLYALLKLPETATRQEIRRAYRFEAMKSHPDLRPGCDHSERRMRELNVAAGVLLDPERRAAYDRHRRAEREAARRRAQASAPRYFAQVFEWERPAPQPRRQRLGAELGRLLAEIHPWPARPLSEWDFEIRSWSLQRHLTFLCVAAVLALSLIAWARPASLPLFCDPNCPQQPVTVRL